MNHLSSRVQISSLRHHDAGRPAGEFGGLVKIRRRNRERAQVGDGPLLETQGIAAVLVVAAMTSELRSRMAGNPLLIRPFGAFEPVRLVSRPTERTAARATTGSKEESRIISPEDLSLRNENGCDRRVRPHPPPRRSGGAPRSPHTGGPAPIFATEPTRTPRCCCRRRQARRDRGVGHRSACRCQRRGRALADHAADVRFCADHFFDR
jgi:hypothetical protein